MNHSDLKAAYRNSVRAIGEAATDALVRFNVPEFGKGVFLKDLGSAELPSVIGSLTPEIPTAAEPSGTKAQQQARHDELSALMRVYDLCHYKHGGAATLAHARTIEPKMDLGPFGLAEVQLCGRAAALTAALNTFLAAA